MYVIMVYLTTLPIIKALERLIMGWLVNNELTKKKSSWSNLRAHPDICFEKLGETTKKNSVRIRDLRAEIRTLNPLPEYEGMLFIWPKILAVTVNTDLFTSIIHVAFSGYGVIFRRHLSRIQISVSNHTVLWVNIVLLSTKLYLTALLKTIYFK